MAYESLTKLLDSETESPYGDTSLNFKFAVPQLSPVPFHSHYAPSSRLLWMSCGALLSRQSPSSTAIWGKGILLGHLVLEDFNGRSLNGLTLSPEQVSVLLGEPEQSSTLTNTASPQTTQSRPQLPPQSCQNLLFLCLLKKIDPSPCQKLSNNNKNYLIIRKKGKRKWPGLKQRMTQTEPEQLGGVSPLENLHHITDWISTSYLGWFRD